MIEKSLFGIIKNRLFKGKAIIILAPCQLGEAALLPELLKKRECFFNGDDSAIREILQNVSSAKLKTIIRKNKIVFIDEDRRIDDIGITLKLIAGVDSSAKILLMKSQCTPAF